MLHVMRVDGFDRGQVGVDAVADQDGGGGGRHGDVFCGGGSMESSRQCGAGPCINKALVYYGFHKQNFE
ncbi:hypothetical protein WJ973_06960 [Achromobacter xylosoxidans]